MEGDDLDAIDPQTLKNLFKENDITIRILPLGSSSKIRAVTKALYPHHPDYYFLVDRDHRDDETVESSWRNFPDANTGNLLFWRRREIENYFLIPEYLMHSQYRKDSCSLEKLQQCIRETASKRVFLDIANGVISDLKNKLDKHWIERFNDKKTTEFGSSNAALAKLMEKHEVAKQACDILDELCKYPITDHFNEAIKEFFGDQQDTLEFGHGSWLEMIKGKLVLPDVVNTCFHVHVEDENRKEKALQGPDAVKEVVKSLLKLPLEEQPADFRELYTLISARVSGKI